MENVLKRGLKQCLSLFLLSFSLRTQTREFDVFLCFSFDLHYFILLRNRDLRCEGLEWKTLETEVAIDFWA